MTTSTVLVVYAALVATLALAVSLLLLRSLAALQTQQPPPVSGGSGRRLASLPPSGPALATPAPPIQARTSTAAWLDTAELAGRSYLLAFLSSSCRGCRETLPILTDYASRLADPQRLITVIAGERGQGADLEQRLAGLATIVCEPEAGNIVAAYRITVFPSYVLVSETGTVLATGHSVPDLPQPGPSPSHRDTGGPGRHTVPMTPLSGRHQP